MSSHPFLPAHTNTRPLSLSLSFSLSLSLSLCLPLSLSLPLFLFLSQTHTRRTAHTFAQHRRSLTHHLTHTLRGNKCRALSHYCTPPLFCAAVNVRAISKVLNQLCAAEPVNGLGKCGALQSPRCSVHIL